MARGSGQPWGGQGGPSNHGDSGAGGAGATFDEAFDEAWSRNDVIRKLWELRERDARAVAELSTRVERVEGAFEATWSLFRGVEVDTVDLRRRLEDLESAFSALMTNQVSESDLPPKSPESPEPPGPAGSAPDLGPVSGERIPQQSTACPASFDETMRKGITGEDI